MAEITVLAALIPKMITLLDIAVKLNRNMHRDLESIKRELEYMKDFLSAADGLEEESGKNGVWLGQVRDASFESEDIVDEFMLHFSRDHLDISGSSCCSRLTSMVINGRAKHDIASRMQGIIAKFEDIRKAHDRYCTPNPKPEESAGQTWCNPQLVPIKLVGTEVHEKNLVDMLVSVNGDNELPNVVSVFGMGGVGKTSLVKKVYDNPEVKNHFQGRIWIKISRIFKLDKFLKELVQSLYEAAMGPEPDEIRKQLNRQEVMNMNDTDLRETATDLLMANAYLIVLDDVWSIVSWQYIRNWVLQECGVCQVVITTRNRTTALAACGGQVNRIYELKPLSYNESLELFYTKIFGSPNDCPDHLDEVSKNILKKCAGLPLAIVAVAGVLYFKRRAQSDEWGRIDNILQIQNELKGTQRVLSLSYNDLPHDIKPCFLYLSVFPEGHFIMKMRLVRLWITEGFVVRKNGMTQEEVAESYLDELISRSLIQVVERTGDGKVVTFRIHDLLREMIIMKAKDQKFAEMASECNHTERVMMRRLSFSSISFSNDSERMERNWNLGQLRSLLIFDHECSITKSSMPALFSKDFSFKLLTVLDLEGTDLDKFPSTIVKLVNLRYLNLSHTKVEEVPSSIRRLRKLETLDLSSTPVSRLPKTILKLQHLRDILTYHIQNEEMCGVRAPTGIEGLPSLENLYFLDAEKYTAAAVKEFAPLHRLGITNLNNDNANAICSRIKDFRYLHFLSMSSSESRDWDMDLQHLVSPSDSLRRLHLTGKLVTLPHWLEAMHNLVTLHLTSSKLQDDPIEILGRLPKLMHLELGEAYTGAEMRFRAGHFLKLKALGLYDFQYLEKVILENQVMPNLETLIMENNKLMKEVPSGIENLSKLKELTFVDMAAELEIVICGISVQGGIEYEKIKHVPEVNWVRKDENSWKIQSLGISAGRNEKLKRSMITKKASAARRANITLLSAHSPMSKKCPDHRPRKRYVNIS